VYCRIEECLRSPSVENRAVLFVLKNILVSRTEEFDYISMLLLPHTDCYFYFSGTVLVSERRSESGGRIGLDFGAGGYYCLANILRHDPIQTAQEYLILKDHNHRTPNIISALSKLLFSGFLYQPTNSFLHF